MTGEEIIAKLSSDEAEIEAQDFYYGEFDSEELGLGPQKSIEEISETNGHAHIVRHFTDHDVYIKLTGWYSSYTGSCEYEEENYSVVKPEQKTITVYN